MSRTQRPVLHPRQPPHDPRRSWLDGGLAHRREGPIGRAADLVADSRARRASARVPRAGSRPRPRHRSRSGTSADRPAGSPKNAVSWRHGSTGTVDARGRRDRRGPGAGGVDDDRRTERARPVSTPVTRSPSTCHRVTRQPWISALLAARGGDEPAARSRSGRHSRISGS